MKAIPNASLAMLCLVLLSALVSRSLAEPVISEFLADNTSGIAASDGERHGWIEILNPTSEPLKLDGYFLTNDSRDLKKWRLPGIMLDPGGYLFVFASGKDHTDPSGEFHTPFTLATEDGFLALVRGRDDEIVDRYSGVTYPAQQADISYGRKVVTDVSNRTVIAAKATCRIQVPKVDIGSDWRRLDFDDRKWQQAETGIGYEQSSGYEPLIGAGGDVGTKMHGRTGSVYVRIPFDIGETRPSDQWKLGIKYDDGFVAYLNGTKVAESNAPEPLTHNAMATGEHADAEAVVFREYDITSFRNSLKPDGNLLAIHGLNASLTSSDFLILPELYQIAIQKSTIGRAGYFRLPTPGEINADPYDGFLGRVSFSKQRGLHEEPFVLKLSAEETKGSIRYTLNGDVPSPTNGKPYTRPVPINRSTIVRAAAVEPHYHSPVETHTYLFLDDVMDQSPLGGSPEGWPEQPVNDQVFDFGMDPDIVGKVHTREEVRTSLESLPTASIVLPLDEFVGEGRGIYVNAMKRGKGWERAASFEVISKDGESFQIDAGLRVRGGATRQPEFFKRGFRLFYRKAYGESKLRRPMFGSEGTDQFDNLDFRTASNHSWARKANHSSNPHFNTFLRDVFARDTQGALSQPYTRSRYYHLYLNGIYWGVYQSQERPKAAFGSDYFGGAKDDYDAVKTSNHAGGFTTEATDGNLDAWKELWEQSLVLRDDPSNAIYFRMQGRNESGERDASLRVLLDAENLADYMLLIYYIGDGDAPLSSFLGYRRANNWHSLFNRKGNDGFQFFCHDAEHSLDVPTAVGNRARLFPTRNPSFIYSNPEWIHHHLLRNEEYRLLVADRAHKHLSNDGAMTAINAIVRLKKRANQLRPAIIAHSARWGDAIRANPYTKADWERAVSHLLESYLPTRTAAVLKQLETANLYPNVAAPVISESGGKLLKITNPNQDGTFYYTLNGEDPRAIGGAPNPNARWTQGSVLTRRLENSLHLKVRIRVANGTWSALSEIHQLIGEVAASSQNIEIAEINYDPKPPSDSEKVKGFDKSSDFEFLKIANTTDEKVSLSSVRVADGVRFDFRDAQIQSIEPQRHIYLVKNAEAFKARHGASLPVAGEYAGKLANEGERIVIKAANGSTIVDVRYPK